MLEDKAMPQIPLESTLLILLFQKLLLLYQKFLMLKGVPTLFLWICVHLTVATVIHPAWIPMILNVGTVSKGANKSGFLM